MAYDFQVTIDCAHPHVLADWWADALGWVVEPSDEAFVRSMIDQGYASERDTTTHRGTLVWKEAAAILMPSPDGKLTAGQGRRILFMMVPEPKTVKNRVHLDVRVGADNVDAEVGRLTAAGASVLHRGHLGEHTWVTMADPEGNELCLS